MLLSVAIRQRIVNLTKSKHISLRELSRRSNVSYSTLINFMTGKGSTITLATLYKLCLGLNLELADFFNHSLFIDVIDEHEKSSSKF